MVMGERDRRGRQCVSRGVGVSEDPGLRRAMIFFVLFFGMVLFPHPPPPLKGYPDPKCLRELIKVVQLWLKPGGWGWRSDNPASLLFPAPAF